MCVRVCVFVIIFAFYFAIKTLPALKCLLAENSINRENDFPSNNERGRSLDSTWKLLQNN